jgi:iron complex outermembrane recepter protein
MDLLQRMKSQVVWIVLLLPLFAVASEYAPACAQLRGQVIDAQSNQPLPLVNVQLENLGLGAATDGSGHFEILHLPLGKHTLHVSRLGYRSQHVDFELSDRHVQILDLRLWPEAVHLRDLSVQAEGPQTLHEPILELNQSELQRQMGTTVAEVLEEEAGISRRSMGPAPARPVLRGLSGDRLLMLEDGHGTGDLSGSSADHAVAIEPATSQRIELLRGPSALRYSSAAMGGVVNVERALIPTQDRERVSGQLSSFLGGASLARQVALGLQGPLSLFQGDQASPRLQWHTDASFREGSNLRTPQGELINTGLQTEQLGVGLSYSQHAFRLGLGWSSYESEYGIPGGFVGAHPNGVDIDLRRRGAEFRAFLPLQLASFPLLESMTFKGSHSRYWHAEYESSGALGLEFGVLNDQLSFAINLGEAGIFSRSEFGVHFARRDYATGGLTHTPNVLENHLGLYVNSHHIFLGLHTEQTLRIDQRIMTPAESYESQLIGSIRRREFRGGSASITGKPRDEKSDQALLEPSFTVTSTWRPPSIEELFSGGPHLAAYSFEIGNPELNSERGLGLEVALDLHTLPLLQGALSGRVALYQNQFTDYIFPAFTGRLSPRRADLYEYRYLGQDAVFRGIDFEMNWRMGSSMGSSRWNVQTMFSQVYAKLTERNTPLPEIPPMHGKLILRRFAGVWMFEVGLHGASKQDRVYQWESQSEDQDVEREPSTAGWARLDMAIEWKPLLAGRMVSINLKANNLLDREYADHLSRVRSVMPEAGRSVSLQTKLWW